MTCYIITFETHSDATRQRVCDVLKTYSGYCPIHTYCWAILSDKKATAIRDEVSAVLQANERLFVIRSGTEAAWRNPYGEKNSQWLKKNL